MQDSPPILEVENVTKAFDGVRAVNSCTLSVERATITGLIGPNGAGKTTLFNLITGFLKPSSGRILFRRDQDDGAPPSASMGCLPTAYSIAASYARSRSLASLRP